MFSQNIDYQSSFYNDDEKAEGNVPVWANASYAELGEAVDSLKCLTKRSG